MLLNQATDYAFRAVLYLAQLLPGEVVEAQVIAEHECVPMRFLLKILRLLTKADITTSYRGIGGGYALAKAPREITLLDVLEAVEGPVRINRCLIDPDYCSKKGTPYCSIHQSLASIQQAIVREFSKYDFEQLAGRNKTMKTTIF